jgi:hypothetical protein
MKIRAIALNTFKEAIRDRILYLLFFFAAIALIFSRLLAVLTVGDRAKIVKDVGLASISIFGVLMAILIGTGLVYKEIDKKTVYTLLSKPIQRWQFLLGKFSVSSTLFIMTAVMGLIFPSSSSFNAEGWRPHAAGHIFHLPRAHPDHRRGHPLFLFLDPDPELDILAFVLSDRPSQLGPRDARPEDPFGYGKNGHPGALGDPARPREL